MNPRVFALDLEMNQPSQKIIQIGLVIGDLKTGNILLKKSYLINPEETLNPFIVTLTGITQNAVDNGISLESAIKDLDDIVKTFKACKSPFVWGNGDLRLLKKQSAQYPSVFRDIHREMDVKTLHQFLSLAKGLSMKGGLEAALERYGLTFEGRPHNALHDAHNTFLLGRFLINKLKEMK